MRSVIKKRIRRSAGGVNVVADVNAAVVANGDAQGSERSSVSAVSSRQRIVQRSKRRKGTP